jgi:hypothetical protein
MENDMEKYAQDLASQDATMTSSRIARRSLLQAAAAVGIAAVTSPLAFAQPTPAFCYGEPNKPNTVTLDDTTIYPLFAVWLILTTNEDLVPIKGSASYDAQIAALATAVNLQVGCVKKIFAYYEDTRHPEYKLAFQKVREIFRTLIATDLAPATAPYSGGHCPKTTAPVTAIGRLTPTLVYR